MSRKKIQLSDHFTAGRMIRFSLPSIGTMIFTSIYGVVDGFFVSNYAGALPFASLNLAMPFIMILSSVGFMFGSGGTALVSMLLGMNREKKALEIFSLITYLVFGIGAALGIIGFIIAPQMSGLLGATPEMMPYAVLYIRINMVSLPFFMLQNMFQSFFITAEKPKLGLAVTIMAGCTNMFLDWLFVGVLGFGLSGAAAATAITETSDGLISLIYFFMPNSSTLHLVRTHMDGKAILKACTNGSSELLSNSATSIVSMLFNFQLMKYFGSNGVAAYGVIMYVNFIFVGIYFGYTMAITPVIGYHYGADNQKELKNLFETSIKLFFIVSLLLTGISELAAPVLVRIFVSYNAKLYALSLHAFRIFSISYIFMGFNIFGSGFFTALNNGKISAILSFARSLLLQLISIYVLPAVFGPDGLWCAVVVSNVLCLILTIYMWVKYRKVYHY